jgi:hypothetical protein
VVIVDREPRVLRPRREVFGEQLREKTLGGQVDRRGPLEVVREGDGFAITRPSREWGVALPSLAKELDLAGSLVLVHPGKDAYVDVTAVDLGGQTLTQYRDQVEARYRDGEHEVQFAGRKTKTRQMTGHKVRDKRTLPARDGVQGVEVVLDVQIAGQPFTFLHRIVKEDRGNRAYELRAWSGRRRFPRAEAEMRKALDSFRLLPARG